MHKLNNFTGIMCAVMLGIMFYNMYAAKKENTGNFLGYTKRRK